MEYFALIVAGGSGARMKTEVPKQFLLISGRPVLMHTIEAFHYSSLKPKVIVVLNKDFHSLWKQLCQEHNFKVEHLIIEGGRERFHSVKNGLELIRDSDAIVAIHDAVRPIISDELITKCFRGALLRGAVVPGVVSKDSIRQVQDNTSQALQRDNIYLMQTPQSFKIEILKDAYRQTYTTEFTDDASVVEKAGYSISILEGEHSNIKITYPEDLAIAELLYKKSGLSRI